MFTYIFQVAKELGTRVIVESSRGKYNVWFVCEKGFGITEDLIREGLFFLLGGDAGSNKRGQVGRLPSTKNSKYSPAELCSIIEFQPGVFLKQELFVSKIVEKKMKTISPNILLRKILAKESENLVFEKAKTRKRKFEITEGANYEVDDNKFEEFVFPGLENVKVCETQTSFKYEFILNKETTCFELFKLPFTKNDGLVDRSRLDWAWLTIVKAQNVSKNMSTREKQQFYETLFVEFSVKYKDTLRTDYMKTTIRNFLKDEA